jgi:hypothetical protein
MNMGSGGLADPVHEQRIADGDLLGGRHRRLDSDADLAKGILIARIQSALRRYDITPEQVGGVAHDADALCCGIARIEQENSSGDASETRRGATFTRSGPLFADHYSEQSARHACPSSPLPGPW